MNLSFKNGWGLFAVALVGFIINIGSLHGMEEQVAGCRMFAPELCLNITEYVIPADIEHVSKVSCQKNFGPIRFMEEITEEYRRKDAKKIADALRDLTSLSEVNRVYHDLVNDQTITKALLRAIPSDRMLLTVRDELNERRKNKKQIQMPWCFQYAIRSVDIHIRNFRNLIRVNKDDAPSSLQKRIGDMLDLGVNPNFVIRGRSFLAWTIQCDDQNAMNFLMTRNAHPNYIYSKEIFCGKKLECRTAFRFAIEKNPSLAAALLEDYNNLPLLEKYQRN